MLIGATPDAARRSFHELAFDLEKLLTAFAVPRRLSHDIHRLQRPTRHQPTPDRRGALVPAGVRRSPLAVPLHADVLLLRSRSTRDPRHSPWSLSHSSVVCLRCRPFGPSGYDPVPESLDHRLPHRLLRDRRHSERACSAHVRSPSLARCAVLQPHPQLRRRHRPGRADRDDARHPAHPQEHQGHARDAAPAAGGEAPPGPVPR